MPTITPPDLWLVAHDLSPLGDAAALEASRLASRSAGKVVLLHVHPVDVLQSNEATGQHTLEVERPIRARLNALRDRILGEHPGLDISLDVLPGDAKERILSEAERLGARHLALGTHDRKGIKRLVLGSVAESIVHASPISVLVVKGPAPAA